MPKPNEIGLIVMKTEPDYEERTENDAAVVLVIKVTDANPIKEFIEGCESERCVSDVEPLWFPVQTEDEEEMEGFMFGTIYDEHKHAIALGEIASRDKSGMIFFTGAAAQGNLEALIERQPNHHRCGVEITYDPSRDRIIATAGAACIHTYGPITHRNPGSLAGDNTAYGCLQALKDFVELLDG